MKTDLFQSCGHCWVFQLCWHIECSSFTASSFRIWDSSTGIPSPPLALFIVMLSKAHLTSHPGCLALDEWSHHRAYLGRDSPNVPMPFLRKGLYLKKADISQTTLGGLQGEKSASGWGFIWTNLFVVFMSEISSSIWGFDLNWLYYEMETVNIKIVLNLQMSYIAWQPALFMGCVASLWGVVCLALEAAWLH